MATGAEAKPGAAVWRTPGRAEILCRPLPHLPQFKQRFIVRSMMTMFGRDIVGVHDWEPLKGSADPFIAVINHSTRLEALMLPTLFAFMREGRLIAFIADWNFALIPGIAGILRAGETILLVRKPARPAFLNVLKPLFLRQGPAFERAARALSSGRSVGIFPEGTTNRHPTQLLRGFDGAARLSLTTGCPILPIGVRFPGQRQDQPVPDRAPMEIFVGQFLRPPGPTAEPARDQVRAWHATIMHEIGRLSAKRWEAGVTRKKHHGLD